MGFAFATSAPSCPLFSLAWGARRPEGPVGTRRGGWTYLVVEAGAVIMSTPLRRKRVPAPALVVAGPDSALQSEDDPAEPSRHFAWTWARPAHAAITRLGAEAFLYFALTAEELTELRHLHASTRHEAGRADQHSDLALTGLQYLLETRVARILDGGNDDPRREVVDRALDWIQAHASARQPLARLADFLGISPATVQRLFRDRLGTTVMKRVADIRLREAERLLAGTDVSVKEIAYRLGYRHPHDFSRAFRNRTGKLPSRWGTTASEPAAGKEPASRLTLVGNRG